MVAIVQADADDFPIAHQVEKANAPVTLEAADASTRQMNEPDWLAERFQEHRPRLRAVAYRVLGSTSEAEDAVQEAWIRLSRSDAGKIENLEAWLVTVVGRVALDILRARKTRREESLETHHLPDPIIDSTDGVDPQNEALLADSVGLALLVVLETLTPAERLAFVLHDMFAIPFEDIAPIVERTPEAARQLASRARRRVRGAAPTQDTDLPAQWEVIDAFLAAARDGDFEGLVAVLDPDVVLRSDGGAITGLSAFVRGAEHVARRAQMWARADLSMRRALVNGGVGMVAFLKGKPFSIGAATIREGRIVELDFLVDPKRIADLDLSKLD
jgi:RNA polymerase sigma factor (sigma-70 family)